ncbi:MAG: methyltransferase domain-containing protein [Gemmatimonadetes bacterium]|nr:methyltransferase domain-containing protein [Gemmatimonadota bacterium]
MSHPPPYPPAPETRPLASPAAAGDVFANSYADVARADAYARLEFPGSYYLAFRDLPALIGEVAPLSTALDFGCGAGRSTRFLSRLGFLTTGVDIAAEMLAQARQLDPRGDYRLVADGDIAGITPHTMDLALCAFTFDNIPGWERKVALFRLLKESLRPGGRILNLVSAPELYVHEWASFSTRDFAGNAVAKTGDLVRTIILDTDDHRPVDDVFWSEADYREVYRRAGLEVRSVHRPLGHASDPCAWVNEERLSPWTIYTLAASDAEG